METEPKTSLPFLRILRGEPSDVEIAALVAVLAAASGARATAQPAPGHGWSARSRSVRDPLYAGPGGWRASAMPR